MLQLEDYSVTLTLKFLNSSWFATVFVCCVFPRLGVDFLKLAQQFMESSLEFDLFLQQGFRVFMLYLWDMLTWSEKMRHNNLIVTIISWKKSFSKRSGGYDLGLHTSTNQWLIVFEIWKPFRCVRASLANFSFYCKHNPCSQVNELWIGILNATTIHVLRTETDRTTL